MKRLLLIFLPILILGVGFLTARYMLDTRREVTPAEDPSVAAGEAGDIATVTTLSIARQSAAPEWQLYGRLRAQRQVNLVAPLAGEVMTLSVDNGDQVLAGDTLLQLDVTGTERQLAQLRQRERELAVDERQEARDQVVASEALAIESELVAIAERAVSRIRDLQQRNLASASDLEEAERNLQSQRLSRNRQQAQVDGHEDRLERIAVRQEELRLDIEQLQDDISNAVLTAPFDGEVTAVSVSEGNEVAAQATLLTVLDRTSLRVESSVPLHQSTLLRRGMTGTLVADGATVPLTLERWEPVSRGGSVQLQLSLDAPAEGLNADAFHPLRLALPPVDDVFVIPVSALYENRHVYVVADDRLQRQPVTVVGYQGSQRDSRVLVRSDDLSDGDRILHTRLANAVTGLPVIVREGDE